MMKKVAILNSVIEHVYHEDTDKTIIKGATIEDREMEYTEENGWREVNWNPPKSEVEQLKEQIQSQNEAIAELTLLLYGGM